MAATLSSIAVIGGGASGIFAALGAAENPADIVTIYERGARIGRKILATGNGRCNMTNLSACRENYHGSDADFVKPVIEKYWVRETLEKFSKLGVLYKTEEGAKVYPYCDRASAVLDALRAGLDRLGVIVKCGFDVQSVKKKGGGFLIRSYGGENVYADKVIVATGGRAAPDLGSNGSGYDILKMLGHSITDTRPSLVQIKTRGQTAKKLKGIKVNAAVTLGEFSEYGEVLFTDYGLSGPAVFSLSSRFEGQEYICLDIMPEYTADDIAAMLITRRKNAPETELEAFFTGMLDKRVGQAILKEALYTPLSRAAKTLTDTEINKTAVLIKDWRFKTDGTMSWNNAQVTKGGARTAEFNPNTLESKLVHGLYAAGEVLDIDGDCGGYNLQWAWSTGYIAGKNSGEVK